MANVLVYGQLEDGAVHDISLQGVAVAREVADATGGSVIGLVAGPGARDAAAALIGRGADEVLTVEAPALEQYLTAPYCAALKAALAAKPCDLVLLPATTDGDDLAPVAAAGCGAGCVVGGDTVEVVDGRPAVGRREFDGKVLTLYAAAADKPLFATLKDGVAAIPEVDPGRAGEAQTLEVAFTEADTASAVVSRDVAPRSVNLKDARVIVAAGAGVGTAENFGCIRELADALGAEVGATRAVVDAGWLPADHQIGQTGATVKPDVYIACGISGAVQHRVGMSDSKTIVAVNTDKSAPIFKIAHYRIVGDLNAVVPRMTKLLK